MGQGRLRSGQAGDVEGERLRPASPDVPFERERERGFGDARGDLRQKRGERPVGDGTGGGDPLELGGLLRCPVGLDPALDRHEVDVRCGSREEPPHRVADEACLDRHPPRPDRCHDLRPAGRQVAIRLAQPRVRRLPASLDRVPAIGEDDSLLGTDDELTGDAGDLLLALAEGETGQVAHVLPPDPEVGVDAGGRESGTDAIQASRTGDAIRLDPALSNGSSRRTGEIGRLWQPVGHSIYPYFRRFASCSLMVRAKTCVPPLSGTARK